MKKLLGKSLEEEPTGSLQATQKQKRKKNYSDNEGGEDILSFHSNSGPFDEQGGA